MHKSTRLLAFRNLIRQWGYAVKRGISGHVLKWTAIITMVIDHFAVAVYRRLPDTSMDIYEVMRKIGRISFPIYCFLLVEGFYHTKNLKNYIGKMLLFAVISEIPFDMAIYGRIIYPYRCNIYFTLALGLITISLLERFKYKYDIKSLFCSVAIIAVFAVAAQLIGSDYRWKGILFIVMFYYCHDIEKWKRNIIGIITFSYEITAPLAFIPIQLYNGERGRQNKYLFYFLYPVHLLIFGIIRFWIKRHFI